MNNRVLVFGDSITWGANDTKGGWATRLKLYTDQQTIEGKEDYDTIYPLGVSGDNTDDLLARFEVELKSRLDDDSNIVVMLAIGTNDSQFELAGGENRVPLPKFKTNLYKLVEIAKPHVNNIVIVGLTPVDDELICPMPWKPTHGYNIENIEKYNKALGEFANDNGIGFIKLLDIFKETEYKTLLFDGLHPNDEGHKMMFEEILKNLQNLGLIE